MSMQGIGPGGLPAWLRGPAEAGLERGRERPATTGGDVAPTNGTAAQARPQVLAPEAGWRAPDTAPDGVDAELWTLLTSEERAHFARFHAMGGVTYGPTATRPTAPPVQGHRLDVRI